MCLASDCGPDKWEAFLGIKRAPGENLHFMLLASPNFTQIHGIRSGLDSAFPLSAKLGQHPAPPPPPILLLPKVLSTPRPTISIPAFESSVSPLSIHAWPPSPIQVRAANIALAAPGLSTGLQLCLPAPSSVMSKHRHGLSL